MGQASSVRGLPRTAYTASVLQLGGKVLSCARWPGLQGALELGLEKLDPFAAKKPPLVHILFVKQGRTC